MTRPIWAHAIDRLMLAKGYRKQTALIRAAQDRGIPLRPNTLSSVLGASTKSPRLDTLEAIARVLDVPLWALFCTEREYATFTEALAPRALPISSELAQHWAQRLINLEPGLRQAIAALIAEFEALTEEMRFSRATWLSTTPTLVLEFARRERKD
jgi:transcriptional regulator with XRE-family HTH domain